MMCGEERRVLEVVRELGPLAAYRRLIEDNDALIKSPDLDHGRAIVRARTAIHTAMIGQWAAAQQRLTGYAKPFAVVALGGTGRGEVTPCSDLDIAFLFDDALEGNPFLLEVQRQTLHTDAFLEQHGFSFIPLPFGLDDVPELAEKQLNSFLDMAPVFDPGGLERLFRERIRATFDPFEHFLHVRGFWKNHWEAAAAVSENLNCFDIKNDSLRLFLGGVWTLAGKGFRHSHEIYAELPDARDVAAYEFLLRMRAWVHLRRGPEPANLLGKHAQDVFGFDDFCSFGEMLGAAADDSTQFEFATVVRARLLSARRRVAVFARGVIERELRNGRAVPPEDGIVLKSGGLQHGNSQEAQTPPAKSSAALSMLLAAQRYGVPVDSAELQTTFCNMGDWLVRVPELSALFYETRGSLADTIEYISQLDGAAERLFPGHGRFEASLDERVMIERTSLRSAWVREKLRALDCCLVQGNAKLAATTTGWNPLHADLREMVANATALLDADQLAAVKLALLTKRLPFTPNDRIARSSLSLPLHERNASGFSGIPLAEYYAPFVTEAGFSQETVRIAGFLVTHRRTFKQRAESGINDRQQVADLVSLCGDEPTLRTLFVFTCVDHLMGMPTELMTSGAPQRQEWWLQASDPARWFNTRELYIKALTTYHPEIIPDPTLALRSAGYVPEEQEILRDFGTDFFSGLYGRHARRFGSHLLRLADDPDAGPKAAMLREGGAILLGLAARDFRGLAACISGALWEHQVNLRQAHLFCAVNHHLALDFFHLAQGPQALPADLPRIIEQAIRDQLHISAADEDLLPALDSLPLLDATPAGNFRLRYETTSDTGGLVYALSLKVFRHLGGSIHCLTANTARGRAYLTVLHSLPPGRSLEEARKIIRRCF
ncbi:MAG: DUF294 nucleotidyltransferase-like domain-containing protein [Verrucomicrobia bacterium]|nr:DUF294 nucleotidyltransferase-like domain-containing protein [Verrucomicrobiota bacterium]